MEILRVAAGDGRLTAAELDARVEAALAARTAADLMALVADLPLEGMPPQAREAIRIDQRLGEGKRTGRWLVSPPDGDPVDVHGPEARLHRRRAQPHHPPPRRGPAHRRDLPLVTRPGVVVDADGLTHSRGEIKLGPTPGPETPVELRVVVTGGPTGGDLVARPPRRPPWQPLRRRPRTDGDG